MKKKELIKYIKSLRIESVELSKGPPETIYMNDIPVKSKQSKFIVIHIIGHEK